MRRRMITVFCLCIGFFSIIMLRVFYVSQGSGLLQVAVKQGSLVLPVAQTRGNIFDCNLNLLTGGGKRVVAAVTPCPEAAAELARVLPVWKRGELSGLMEGGKPFVIELPTADVQARGITVFELPVRSNAQLAVHVAGYTNSSGMGVYGMEKAFEQMLAQHGGEIRLRYGVDAYGRVLEGLAPTLESSMPESPGGLVLSIDGYMQQATEQACQQMDRGAAIVLELATGDIKAMVSRPGFDPDAVSQFLNDPGSPFVNRAVSAFAVGSSFKLAVAAAALEAGITPARSYECTGYIELDGQVFRCNNLAGHGVLDMRQAIAKSCNPYFVTLAMELGAQPVRQMAAAMGFGSGNQLAPGLITAKGNLPELSALVGGELANFGFGQGKLTATPLQVACMTAAIANNGLRGTPRLVLGSTEDGMMLDEPAPLYAQSRIFSEHTAALLQAFMISTVEEGSGTEAKLQFGGAGGKTGSAQTGVFEEGHEVVHAWFTGFFPAEAPRYVCTVLWEGGESGSRAAAPVFKAIAEAILLPEFTGSTTLQENILDQSSDTQEEVEEPAEAVD